MLSNYTSGNRIRKSLRLLKQAITRSLILVRWWTPPGITFRGLGICFAACSLLLAQPGGPRFLRYNDVREIITAFAASDAAALPTGGLKDAGAWDNWVRAQDREIRGRIERGVEDSISNLILYGTSYTHFARLESFEQAASTTGELTEAARLRVHALAETANSSSNNERVQFVRDFLVRHNTLGPPVEAHLSANLQRFIAEQRAYQEKLQDAGRSGDPGEVLFTRGTLFEKRGLSVDTSLLPNYALQDSLEALARKGVLTHGNIRRIAVIGPGLDFTDKRDGYDFYPVQTIQPFAVLEAVLRLGLASSSDVKIVTFDLNPAVNAHVRRLVERARAGHSYIVQLPRDSSADWNPAAVSYWEHFGEIIGSPVAPLPIPKALSGVVLRAVAIPSRTAALVEARDLNVVGQTVDSPFPASPDSGFDLVVATNVLVYYDRFEQALAMASIARMMNVGGIFLANSVLPAQHPAALEYLGRRSISYTSPDDYGDDVVVFRRH
jgi:hypothetical protein